jgi:hypothetical protein
MRESTEAVKAWMHVEIQGLVEGVGVGPQNHRENLLSPLIQRSQRPANSLEAAGIAPDEDRDHPTDSGDTFDADLEVTGQSKDTAQVRYYNFLRGRHGTERLTLLESDFSSHQARNPAQIQSR